MADDWLDKFDIGNTHFELICRLGGGFIFFISALLMSMMIFNWGIYAWEGYKDVIPVLVYYAPIFGVIGGLAMALKPAFFKPREETKK